jgi:hypothetical protein
MGKIPSLPTPFHQPSDQPTIDNGIFIEPNLVFQRLPEQTETSPMILTVRTIHNQEKDGHNIWTYPSDRGRSKDIDLPFQQPNHEIRASSSIKHLVASTHHCFRSAEIHLHLHCFLSTQELKMNPLSFVFLHPIFSNNVKCVSTYPTGQAHLRPGPSSWRSNKEIIETTRLCLTLDALQERNTGDDIPNNID